MSLTWHLKWRDSPVRAYLYKTFPILQRCKDSPSYFSVLGFTSLPPCVLPAMTPGRNQGTIGTALDYRLRYYFRQFDSHETVAASGVSMLQGKSAMLGRKFLDYQNELAARIAPFGRQLNGADEVALNIGCVVLAWFEQVRRSASVSPEFQFLLWRSTLDELLSEVPADVVQDVGQLSTTFASEAKDLFGMKTVLNPLFQGSVEIGGADADIIIGKTLFEFKCISKLNAPKLRDTILQLLGYVLLDYKDEYALSDLGIYFARQRFMWRAPLWKLVLPPKTVWTIVKRIKKLDESVVKGELRKRRQEFRRVVRSFE